MRARSTHMDRGDELEKNPGGDVGAGASEFRVRARFYAIRQVDGERVYDWYRRALAAAVPCGFADDRPVTDKFVTGLRPGPVADRLLGERADGLLVDLVAAAVRVEGTAAVREETAIPPTRHTSSPPRSDHVLDEIREVLKLYRYSGEVANPHGTAPDCGNGHPVITIEQFFVLNVCTRVHFLRMCSRMHKILLREPASDRTPNTSRIALTHHRPLCVSERLWSPRKSDELVIQRWCVVCVITYTVGVNF